MMFSFQFNFQRQNQLFFVLKGNLELNIFQCPTKLISGFLTAICIESSGYLQ